MADDRKMKAEAAEEEKKETEAVKADEVSEAEAKDAEIEALSRKLSDMEAEIAKLKDEELRYRADTENFKKRLRQDKENAIKYANEQLIGDLLTPLDNFSRAIEAAGKSHDFDAMKKGVEMVEDQLLSILRQNWGLEPIDTEGREFDPNEMEAYSAKEEEGLEKEMVLAEFAKGWKLHGKVLRSAKVMVGKPKSN